MIAVFTWTGFICLMLISLSVTYFITVFLIEFSINRTKIIQRTFKTLNSFHKSMPKKDQRHRYAITIYDFKKTKFVETKLLDEDSQTDEEYEALRQRWREENARKTAK